MVEEGSILILVYENYGAYLDVWAQDFVSPNDAPAANYIPPTVKLEEFLFILHVVDSFRRVSYQNMLDHAFTDRAKITITEFMESMTDSLKSLDIRWLLPAFLSVTPGIEGYHTEMDMKNLEILLTHAFFEEETLTSGEETLMFGEAGQAMGVEFFHSWLLSCGFEINVAGSDGFQTVERLFIAPTVLTNHFVQIEDVEEGKASVNHQSYTMEQLMYKLGELFDKAFSMDVFPIPTISKAATDVSQSVDDAPFPDSTVPMSAEPSAGVRDQTKTDTMPFTPKFCRNCGFKLNEGSSFCSNCGMRLD